MRKKIVSEAIKNLIDSIKVFSNEKNIVPASIIDENKRNIPI